MRSLFPTEVLDQPESWAAYFAWFGWFVVFAISLLGWGQWIGRLWPARPGETPQLGLQLAFGSAFLSLFLGGATLLLTPTAIYWICLGLVGIGLFRFRPSALRWDFSLSGWDNFFGFVLALSVFLRLCEGFFLHRHADALICYLTAGRSWVEHGFAEFTKNPVYFFSASWEHLFLFGLLPATQGAQSGLAQGQRFGQWVTAFVADLGTIAIAFRLAMQFRAKRTEALIAALAATTLPILRWMQNLAKNDLGVAFWLLAGCSFLQSALEQKEREAGRNRGLIAAGLVLGLAISGKFSTALILLPVLMVMLGNRAGLVSYVMLGIGGLLGALPTMARNFWLTGNPLFPFLNGIFKSPVLTPSFATTVEDLSRAGADPWKLEFLLAPFAQQPWLALAPLALLVSFFSKPLAKRLGPARLWLAGVCMATLVFCYRILPQSELRYLGAILQLLSILSVVSFLALYDTWFGRAPVRVRNGALIALGVAVVAISNLPLFTLAQIAKGKYQPGTSEILNHSAGKAKKWIRDHAGDFKTAALGDDQLYYMSDYAYHEISYYGPLDQALLSMTSGEEIVRYLKDLNYGFVVDAREISPWDCHNKEGARLLIGYLRQFPRAKVFDEGQVQIYDLHQLWAIASTR